MDPQALLDQAMKQQAVMLGQFRNELVAEGFTSEQAADLVTVWYEQSLQTAALKGLST